MCPRNKSPTILGSISGPPEYRKLSQLVYVGRASTFLEPPLARRARGSILVLEMNSWNKRCQLQNPGRGDLTHLGVDVRTWHVHYMHMCTEQYSLQDARPHDDSEHEVDFPGVPSRLPSLPPGTLGRHSVPKLLYTPQCPCTHIR